MRLARSFFEQKTLQVAKNLLGCFLIRQVGKKKIIGRIIETEAYCGPKDLANHASKGRTKRTEVMFGRAGHAYIYLIYGVYYCFNVVTERCGYPAAVLIRGIELIRMTKNEGRITKIIGPGKVCRELKIDKSFHGADLVKNNRLYFIRLADGSLLHCRYGGQVSRRSEKNPPKIKCLPRAGVPYAKEYKNKLWRFALK